jgi:hypothetical protein
MRSARRTARAAQSRHAGQRIDAGRELARRAVFGRRAVEELRIERSDLAREHRRHRVLQVDRRGASLRDDRAEILVRHEPAVHRARRPDGGRAGAQLDQRHLAEHAPGPQSCDDELFSARLRDFRLDLSGAKHIGAARELAMPHECRAGDERDWCRRREQQLPRGRIEAIEE